jgi:hypothetical protein
MLARKEKDQGAGGEHYQRNGYASEEVEKRAKGRRINVELSEREKDTDGQARKRERIKESRYNREYERCTWREIERESNRKKTNGVGRRREKTGIGRKERKEGAECGIRRGRQSSTCGMDVAK